MRQSLERTQYYVAVMSEPCELITVTTANPPTPIYILGYDSTLRKEEVLLDKGLDPVLLGYIQGRILEIRSNGKSFSETFESLRLESGRF